MDDPRGAGTDLSPLAGAPGNRHHVQDAHTVVAALYGCAQWDVSRELRRLLPLIQQVLSCPTVWQRVAV
jgi:hypothetical protein